MIHSCPHCSKPIEVKNAGRTVSEPGEKVKGHRELGDALFKEVLGLSGKGPVGAAHSRWGKEVRDILAAAGSMETGLQAAKEVAAWLNSGGFHNFTLRAVADHVLLWKADRKKYLPRAARQTFGVRAQPICADMSCRQAVKADGDYCPECMKARS